MTVISVSQSPGQFNMSTGDTQQITLTVTPATVNVNTSFAGTGNPTSNPDSSCNAALSIPGQSGSGTISHSVNASAASCSGVFSVTGSANLTGQFTDTEYYWDDVHYNCVETQRTRSDSGRCDVVTVSITGCNPLHLALGPTAPPSTKTGTCNTTATPAGGSYSWTVNTNTVTLSPAGGSTDYTAANPSSSSGDTVITVTYTFSGKSARAQSPGITVHKPTALRVLSDSTDPSGRSCTVPCLANPGDGTCNASASNCNYNSYLRQRQYSVLDQFSPPNEFSSVGISAAAVTETIPTTTTCTNLSAPTPGSSLESVFSDSFWLCHTCCLPQGPGCSQQTNPVQTITVNGIDVRTETINWTCTGVTLVP